MRELKFRAFDKRFNKMAFTGFNLIGEVTAFNGMHEWIMEHMAETPDAETSLDRWNDFIYMQYTGLKDKNGKEIYEGDVVTSSSGIKAKVIWSDEYALFAMIGSAWKTEHPFIGLDPEKLEIVGNIYEHPTLLQP